MRHPHDLSLALCILSALPLSIIGCAYVEPYEPVAALRHDFRPAGAQRDLRRVNTAARPGARPNTFAVDRTARLDARRPPRGVNVAVGGDATQDANGVNVAARNYAQQVRAAGTARPTRPEEPPQVRFVNDGPLSRTSANRSPDRSRATDGRQPAAVLAAPRAQRPVARPASSPFVAFAAPSHRPAVTPANTLAPRPAAAATAPTAQPAPVSAAPPSAPPPAPRRPSRQELIEMLIEDVRSGSEPAVAKALTAAALGAVDTDRQFDPAAIAELAPTQRDAVSQYHALLILLREDLTAGRQIDPQMIASELEKMIDQPVRVRCLNLCRKVSGFGDYEVIPGNSFNAGRENPMVLYLEMDRFQIHKQESGLHEVRLSQEVVLYTDPGGAAVWKQPSVQIVDVSRNRRRDFFVTQLIRLPQVLGVGDYLLKVTVTDEHGQTMDEIQTPVQLVADG